MEQKVNASAFVYKVIAKEGAAALIEWADVSGALHRSTVPVKRATSGDLIEQEAALGIPFGAPWEALLGAVVAERLANRLHAQGIWTYADAAARVRDFRQVVSETVTAWLLDAARS